MSKKSKKQALTGIFFTLLAHITALAMVLPLIPLLAKDFGSKAFVIGLLMSSYSFFQFLLAPFWGYVSDKWGRKWVIFLDITGNVISYLILAYSDSTSLILLSRCLAGGFGGALTASTAYIADWSGVKERSKNMGLLGLAFGLGFGIGPLLGLLLIFLEDFFVFPFHLAAMGASLLSLFSLFLAWSLEEKKDFKNKRKPLFSLNKSSFQILKPSLILLFFMSFFVSLCLSKIEPTLILFLKDEFLWSKKAVYSLFIYIGGLMALTQGGLIRLIIPRLGEALTIQLSFLLMSLSLVLIAFSHKISFFVLLLGVTGFIVFYCLASSSLKGSLSLLSLESTQGQIFGWAQSLTSFSRILGPALGGFLYQNLSHESPFLLSSFFALGVFTISLFFKDKLTSLGKKEESQAVNEEEFYLLESSQLQNLIDKKIGFSFYQVDEKSFPSLEGILGNLEKKSFLEVLESLKSKDLNEPIVLVCEKGEKSKDCARKLGEKGYKNAYALKGGLRGLIDEME